MRCKSSMRGEIYKKLIFPLFPRPVCRLAANILLKKLLYVAFPVTAPFLAGLKRVVSTLKPLGPSTLTTTMCAPRSGAAAQFGVGLVES